MTTEQIAAKKIKELNDVGAIFISRDESFLSEEEFDIIEELAENLP